MRLRAFVDRVRLIPPATLKPGEWNAYDVMLDGAVIGRVARRDGSYPWVAEPAGDDPRPVTFVIDEATSEHVVRWCRAAGWQFRTREVAVRALTGVLYR